MDKSTDSNEAFRRQLHMIRAVFNPRSHKQSEYLRKTLEKTKNIPLKSVPGESGTGEERRLYRLTTLIREVMKKVTLRWRKLPAQCRTEAEDCFNDVWRVLPEVLDEYDPNKGSWSFEEYMKRRVPDRVMDIQRKAAKNPHVHEGKRKFVTSVKKILQTFRRKYPEMKVFAEKIETENQEIFNTLVDSDFGGRRMGQFDDTVPIADTRASALKTYIIKEEQGPFYQGVEEQERLKQLITEHLNPVERELIRLHEIEEVSLRKLHKKFERQLNNPSFSTFQRRYNDLKDRLQDIFQEQNMIRS